MGKVIGKPYRGKPDVRFDEGAKGNALLFWASSQMLKEHWQVMTTVFAKAASVH